ncbi:hypothetical protein H6G00_32685 [Leptolyngbya sp. FACHB-541]|uniref:alr0857 family protein n=1 Tax=Leptolyngbya sp. FACHB-541 TaxID=2692810 RepID=UPI0016859F9D|nr:alr0857 family protein [Leptolyngbya sp. FACHB-541]MBD2001297.1 hypothetical protein [Leptolyngbya sp. FACHB-541]
MLKFTYTETGLHLEHLPQSVEDWMTLRVILSLRTGQRLIVERGTAAFLLPTNLVGLRSLESAIQQETYGTVTLTKSDAEYVEVSLHGTWVCSSSEEVNGVFVASLGDRTEWLIFKLWRETQNRASPLRR